MNHSNTRKRTLIARRRSYFTLEQRYPSALADGFIDVKTASRETLQAELKTVWGQLHDVYSIMARLKSVHIGTMKVLKNTNHSLLQSNAGWKQLAEELEQERDHWQQTATALTRENEAAQVAMMQLNSRTIAFMEARRDTIALLRDEFHVVVRDYNAGYMTSVQQRIERLYEGFDAFVKIASVKEAL